jgi:hypothetical protein
MPSKIEPVNPTDPEYETLMAISHAGKRNLDYYMEQEEEINRRFHGPCRLVIFNSNEVAGCSDFDEMMELLDSLDEVERSAALQFEQPEHGAVRVL